MVCVNEPGVFRLIFTSRVPAAERFKRWLAHEVLPALHKTGRYEMSPCDPGPDEVETEALAAFNLHPTLGEGREELRLAATLVNEARRTFGRTAARKLWLSLGLPEVSMPALLTPAPDGQAGHWEARGHAALAILLQAPTGLGTVQEVLNRAHTAEAEHVLADLGLKRIDSGDGEWLAVASLPAASEIFEGSAFAEVRTWRKALRALLGVRAGTAGMRFKGHCARVTLVPDAYWKTEK